MKILLTGAFGNIGFSTLEELLRQGHAVRGFDRRTKANEKKARQVAGKVVLEIPPDNAVSTASSAHSGGKVELRWGDIRQAQDVAAAVEGQEVIIHLAFVIPPDLDNDPKGAYEVNVVGTRHLLEAAQQQATPPKILFASTLDVFGHTQDQPPPRKVSDPIYATDDYTRHKIECEEMVRNSGLEWAIYRFADVPPLAARNPHPIMFRIPLNTRLEMLHTHDAGMAVANGVRSPIWGRIWLIGGGPRCQVRYRDYLGRMLDAMGIGMLPEDAFSHEQYCTDWLDTTESQALLNYQRHSFDDIIEDVIKATALPPPVRQILPLFRPIVRRSILKMSPHTKAKA